MAAYDTRTLVVGDMHLKEELILSRLEVAISQTGARRVVFCGDYTDEWHSNEITMLDALDALRSWVKRWRKRGIEIDLVVGNHDMQYLRRIPGPGTHIGLYEEVAGLLEDLDAQMATVVGDCLVTHAGVTAAWTSEHLELGSEYDSHSVCRALNSMYEIGDESELAKLDSAGPGRGGFETPGPLWADQSELYQDPLPDIYQIVGHTPVQSIDLWQIPSSDGSHTTAKLLFCDTFGITQDLAPIGDGSMLLVEGKSIQPITSDMLGIEPWPEASLEWMTTFVLPFL